MKLSISGVEYEVRDAMEKANLNDVYAMTVQTGVGMKTLGQNLSTVDTSDLGEALDDPKVFQALRCLIFLVRRFAGEQVTVESANAFPFSELDFIAEPADEQTEVDPTQLSE